ncbi:MAG: RsmE family RNA methyltransferase [Bacteroidota bacterium]
MTTTFYAPPACFHGNHVSLPPDEARHAVRVLRMREGDAMVVVDGVGGWHEVEVTQVGRDRAEGVVHATRREVGEPSYDLTLGVALLKQASRFEFILEKAVELGACRIVPLITHRTEKPRLKQQRAEHIVVAAMKQSGRTRLPVLDAPASLTDVLASSADGLRAICHEATDLAHQLAAQLEQEASRRATILVGPEGGFTDEEIASAVRCGWRPAALGPRRLRAETAAVTAAAAVMLAWTRRETPRV